MCLFLFRYEYCARFPTGWSQWNNRECWNSEESVVEKWEKKSVGEFAIQIQKQTNQKKFFFKLFWLLISQQGITEAIFHPGQDANINIFSKIVFAYAGCRARDPWARSEVCLSPTEIISTIKKQHEHGARN